MNDSSKSAAAAARPVFSWPAIVLVAAVYVVFLLYAQFGFLHGVRASGHATGTIHAILGAMALAGIAGSFAAPRIATVFTPGGAIALGLVLCIGATSSSALAFRLGAATVGHLAIAAVGLGAGIGLATVALATDLRRLTRARAIGLHVGGGTALAYFACNVPAVFNASSETQAWISAGFAVAGIVAAWFARRLPQDAPAGARDHSRALPETWSTPRGIVVATALFFPLVWFDSAAFAALQTGARFADRWWHSEFDLWCNGALHAGAALAGGWLLDRGRFRSVLGLALALLVAGAWGFPQSGLAGALAVPGYIVGVSLYSTALAAYAALAPAYPGRPAPVWRAVWIYALAGWVASTAGVGLVEQRHSLPGWAAPAAIGLFLVALAVQSWVRSPAPAPSLTKE